MIELNLESEYPVNLRVFNVKINRAKEYGEEDFVYGSISGP